MKKKYTFFVLYLVAVLCMSLFAGCSRNEEIAEVTVHEHEYTIEETKEAACTEAGFTRYLCACGESYTEETDPLGHTPGEWEVTLEPMETQGGVLAQHCTVCQAMLGCEPIAPLPSGTEPEAQEDLHIDLAQKKDAAPSGIQAPAHRHSYSKTVTKEPTCTRSGSAWYGCSCGAGYEEPISSRGHNLYTHLVEGSCTADTIKERICRDCGRVISSTVAETAPGHRFSLLNEGWKVQEKATCDQAGTQQRICKICGDVVETRALEALGHDFKTTETVAPTCEQEGHTTRACTRCDAVVQMSTPALGHAWTAREVVKPTCDQSGYTLYLCAHDHSHTKKADETAPLGHRDTQWKTTQDATCAAEGREEELCGICGKSLKAEAIGKKDHTYQLSDHAAPSCTEGGANTFTCQVCGDSYAENLEALGHDHQVSEKKDPICLEAGFVRSACTRCGDTREEALAVTDHIYALAEHRDATCLEDGVDRFVCQTCGHSYEDAISKTGHNYLNAQHRDPSCTENGADVFTCTLCADSYEETIPARSHQYALSAHRDPSCTEGGSDTYTCQSCGDSYEETISAQGHDHQLVGDNGHVKTFTCPRCGDAYSEIYGEEHHFEEAGKAEPTCTSEGYVNYICADCGEPYTENLPALSHNVQTRMVREATCTQEGLKTSVCTVCGQELSSETVEKRPHQMTTRITREPDCCNEGQETTACALCGGEQTTTSIPKLPHVEEITVNMEATCTQEGQKTVSCALCQDPIREEILPKLPHQEVSETVQPTCTEAGAETVRCGLCGEVLRQTDLAALGHAYEKIHTRPATCEREGEDRYRCARCGDSYGEPIPQLTHSYSISETVNPTCAQAGRIVSTCEHCRDEQVETLPKLDHAYRTTVLSGTCTQEEKTVHTCEGCGDSYEEITGPLGDHLFERTSYRAAACGQDGETVDTCRHCKEKKVEILPALRHDFQLTETVKATCFEGGYMKYTCGNCGETYTNTLPALGHWEGHWEVVREATKTEPGLKRKYCLGCHELLEEGTIPVLPAMDREFVVDMGGGETKTLVGHLDEAMAQEVFDLLNAYRVENGLTPLSHNAALAEGTAIRAPEACALFSHTRPNGQKWNSVSKSAHGENLAKLYRSAQSAMTGWKNSPGHNANMLDPDYRSAAIGVFAEQIQIAPGEYYYQYYYVQLFSRKA